MKPYSNQYCVGYCSENNEQCIKILQRNEEDDLLFFDVIQDEEINFANLTTVRYKAPSLSLYKYICRYLKDNKDYSSFNEPSLYEADSEEATRLLALLRFFNLSLKELKQDIASKQTVTKVITKCALYLKKYVTSDVLLAYVEQAQMFTNVVNVLSFVPDEIRERKLPFWLKYVTELFPDQMVWSLTQGIQIGVTKQCNYFKLNLSELLVNKKKFKQVIYCLKKFVNEPFKRELLSLVNQAFNEIELLLEEEVKFASSLNDAEFLSELNLLQSTLISSKDVITKLEQNISKNVNSIYKIEFLKAVHIRISELRGILQEEYELALRDNNKLGLVELKNIEKSLLNLESSIEQTTNELFKQHETTITPEVLNSWWPELLHPRPKNMFGFTADHYHQRKMMKHDLENIEKYFLKDTQIS